MCNLLQIRFSVKFRLSSNLCQEKELLQLLFEPSFVLLFFSTMKNVVIIVFSAFFISVRKLNELIYTHLLVINCVNIIKS